MTHPKHADRTDEKSAEQARHEHDDELVDELVDESFPASDPPGEYWPPAFRDAPSTRASAGRCAVAARYVGRGRRPGPTTGVRRRAAPSRTGVLAPCRTRGVHCSRSRKVVRFATSSACRRWRGVLTMVVGPSPAVLSGLGKADRVAELRAGLASMPATGPAAAARAAAPVELA